MSSEKQKKQARKVTEIPAACPRCGSTERTKKQRVVEREIAGTLPSGQPYTHVQNWRAKCKCCGQSLAYNSHQNRPQPKTRLEPVVKMADE